MAEPLYRLAPDLRWAVEPTGLILFDLRTDRTWRLDYPHAALWDLLSRGYRSDRLERSLGAIAGLEVRATRRLLRETLDTWCAEGLILKEGSDD